MFLLDSHEIFRKGVRSVLDEEDEVRVVGESGSFPAGVAEIADSRPDVAIVGVRENELSQLAGLRALEADHPDVRLIVLTRTDDDEALEAAMQVGANGYLSKDVPAEQLVSAVHSVAGGHDVIDPSRAMQLMARQRSGEEGPSPHHRLASLTSQERRILDLLAEGLTNQQIADRLFLVEKTVRNHVTRVLAKLGVERRTQAALLVARLGRDTVPSQSPPR